MSKIEIRNLNEYNPEYRKDKSLIWKAIGKNGRTKKEYPNISIDKIVLPKNMDYDSLILDKSREMYKITEKMIPVYLSYNFRLLAGFEQYILAKELGLTQIPFQRVAKASKQEINSNRNNTSIKTKSGIIIYTSIGKAKKIKQNYRFAKSNGWEVIVHDGLTFSLRENKSGKYLIGNEDKGKSLNGFRRKLFRLKDELAEEVGNE